MNPSFSNIKVVPDGRLGVAEAEVVTNSAVVAEMFDNPDGRPVWVKVSASAGSLILQVRLRHGNPELRLAGSRFEALGLDAGQQARIERICPVEARRLVVRAPMSVSDSALLSVLRAAPFCAGDKLQLPQGLWAEVAVVEPDADGYFFAENTLMQREVVSDATPIARAPFGVRLAAIGGLAPEIGRLKEALEWPLLYPLALQNMGVTSAPGIILHGPSGTGKTLLLKAICAELNVKVFPISGAEILDKYWGESERKLRQLFAEAAQHRPAVVAIDELDALAPRRSEAQHEGAPSVVATLLTLMDGLLERRGLAVVATTNRLEAIDPALLREGRFGLQIPIMPPSEQGRVEIFAIHTRLMPLTKEVDLNELARKTHGYVGADLKAVCMEAAFAVLRRHSRGANDGFPPKSQLEVSQADFEAAIEKIKPSSLSDFRVEVPRVTWADVGGLEGVKQLLQENVVLPIRKRSDFERMGLKPARGVLLHGAPGTGKTLLAKAVASECGVNFISIKAGELLTKWLGQSEANLRNVFDQARLAKPCVIFFDELDAFGTHRGDAVSPGHDGVVNALLAELDGVESTEGVFVIGATNRLSAIDPALLRPGRFDYVVEIPLPDAQSRLAILRIHIGIGMPLAGADLDAMVQDTDGFSGAQLAGVVREAKMDALREADYDADKARLSKVHFQRAIEKTRATSNHRTRQIGFRP